MDEISLAVIADQGSNYQIIGTRKNPSTEIYDKDKFVEISKKLQERIDNDISFSDVFISKEDLENLRKDITKEVQLKVKTIDVLLKEKTYAFSTCRSALQNRLGTEITLDFFDYTNLNNLFLSKGFNIVKDQEDTFFDIISSDDENLKEKLGDYLELYDKINSYRENIEKFEEAKKTIFKAETKEEIDEAKRLFISLFN